MSKYEGIYTLLFGIFIRESSFWYLNPFQLIHPKQGSIARKKKHMVFQLGGCPFLHYNVVALGDRTVPHGFGKVAADYDYT